MDKYVGLGVLFVGFPIVMLMLLTGIGIEMLAILGVSAALGFLLNCFKQ